MLPQTLTGETAYNLNLNSLELPEVTGGIKSQRFAVSLLSAVLHCVLQFQGRKPSESDYIPAGKQAGQTKLSLRDNVQLTIRRRMY